MVFNIKQTRTKSGAASIHKLDYITQVQGFLYLKEYQNGIIGSKVTAISLFSVKQCLGSLLWLLIKIFLFQQSASKNNSETIQFIPSTTSQQLSNFSVSGRRDKICRTYIFRRARGELNYYIFWNKRLSCLHVVSPFPFTLLTLV